jgi:cytochrome P450/deferrochelatase/peroxidase EfeB
MPKVKYFEAITIAQAKDRAQAAGQIAEFDFTSIATKGAAAKIKAALFQQLLGPIYALSRAYFPIMKLAGFYHVTRDAQVRDILARPETFEVPFGPEMNELAGGVTFALGIDGPDQARQNAIVRKVIRPAQDMAQISVLTKEFARALLDNSGGRIDIMNDLIRRTTTEVAIRYFGFSVDDPDAFADWMMASSALLFGDPYGDEKIRKLALSGAVRLRQSLDETIRRAKASRPANRGTGDDADTIVDRLVALQRDASPTDPISDAEIRAILFGMATGFIPTNSLAAGKMMQELISRPAAYASAVKAANSGEEGRKALKKMLLEAARFNPAISPGVWRFCEQESVLNVDGKIKTIPAKSLVLVSTMSAMRDKRVIPQPTKFWPDRVDAGGKAVEPDLMFGDGIHQCLGKYLAIEQITEVFMVLLSQPGLRPAPGKAGKMQFVGPFPRNLDMVFDTPTSQQSMFLVIAPVTSGASKATLDAVIRTLGHPAEAAIRQALDETGLVHFCSLATIESEKGIEIVFELSVDGPKHAALHAISKRASDLLRPIFAHSDLKPDEDLAACMRRHIVDLHGKPWGANGLNYNGTGEFPVSMIAKQAKFGKFVSRVMTDFLGSEANRGSHAMLALSYVRRIINQDRILALGATPSQAALMKEARDEKFDAYRLTPGGSSLKLAAFKPVTKSGGLISFLTSRESLIVWGPAVAILALFSALFWHNAPVLPNAGMLWIGSMALIRGLLATLVVLIAIPTLFFWAIRRAEKSDWIDTSQASLAHIEALGAVEDTPGYAQNHILAMGEIKPGFLRAFAHAFALWGIKMIIIFNYRPGFVINMGTIHYARWWRVPGTNKTAFYSNFDGSWESYLEDFITRARWGQTAVWSNWIGFPETKFLINKGAEDGDRFKRWVRKHQQVVPFWYSRFPTLSTDQIRNNALIHSGVARAQSHSEAEEWLRCFGSMPRVENRIESDEVQALVFSGLKRLKFSSCITVQLPPAGERLGEWLSWVRGEAQALDVAGAAGNGSATGGLMDGGVIVPVYGRDGTVTGYALANSLTLTFGDRPLVGDASIYDSAPAPMDSSDVAAPEQGHGEVDAKRMARRAVFLGCSAAGLAKFDAPNMAAGGLSETFPPAFRMGMAKRGRSLGDIGAAHAQGWRWGDALVAAKVAEAVLFIYSETVVDLAYTRDVHASLLQNYGGAVINVTDCAPARIDQSEDQHDFEHFGYRDGISQPVIRGTQRSVAGVPARDVVEPGEFILGYANGQGFFPPSPLLPPEADPGRNLPQLSSDDLSRFPDFGNVAHGHSPRDFGRNGSFVVIRELRQDVDGFEGFCARKAEEVRSGYRDIYKVIGQFPDKDWVKAKLMGRWPNGRPLIGNPVNTPSPKVADPDFALCSAAEHENDFTYGADDPQGLACPFGSHMRRTNPRDSKQPGDKAEQAITNRHRLLRRGRTYTRQGEDGAVEKGLLFVSLCTDLERQFEFVQQVWSNSPSFHGLADEPDPIIGVDLPNPETGRTADRVFTIPSSSRACRILCGSWRAAISSCRAVLP